MALHFYVLDTETTGLSLKVHQICEYSIIRCSDCVQLTRQIKVANPKNASWDALKITGKTIQDLYKGIEPQQAIIDFHNFIDKDGVKPNARCLIGHNISFDRKFLHAMWETENKTFPFDLYLDTVMLAKRLAAQQGNPKARVKLDMAMDLFGLKKFAGLHTAQGDARNTYMLWKHLMDKNIEYVDLIKQMPHIIKGQETLSEEDINNLLDEI